ncbi:MAG: hypothetical protein CVT92_02785 [Bacteroidetes bacterium HGW-Bacteroidetes-1]|jgi:hypothetical protein|nr:MAG: hypothetical protein CVT92_02785 [Bacteroidetes bacterium HGW-Bacteroidetes-1]
MKNHQLRVVTKGLVFLCCSLLFISKLMAQTGFKQPGIQFVMISFDQPPTNVTVQKAPLRYNKDFALSFHADDGIADLFTVGFPFFTGINTSGSNYPGLFYTDGCGNDISFKLSSSVFSYSGYNNEDMHQPDNGYGTVTWPQLSLMYQNGCAIFNHGFTSDAFTNPSYMAYSIRRNESFIRRELLTTTPGGVRTRVFVNPNGATDYTQAAFSEGYLVTFRMGSQAVIPDNGLDVNSFTNWNQPLEMNRKLAESVNVQQLADQLAANSTNGANFWMPVFTHRIIEDYPQNSFFSDFNYIANTYGKSGADNIWMTNEQEIIDYLQIGDATTVNYGISGNTLIITFSGNIPDDLRYYPLTLTVQADATITSINIAGGTNNSYAGVGQTQALINLEWNGFTLSDKTDLAESVVAIAEQDPTQYNALIAMDYVLMMPNGPLREALKNRLCAIEGVTFETGFCVTCEFNLGPDETICAGECLTLFAPEASGSTYIWNTGETTSSINVCPTETSTFYVQMTTADACIASDTIVITVLPAPVFDLGPDKSECRGETILIEGPVNSTYTYQWFANGSLLPETSATLEFILLENTFIRLDITVDNGCIASDILNVTLLPAPDFDLGPDRNGCQGETLHIEGPENPAYSYQWFADGSLLPDTNSYLEITLVDTVTIRLEVTGENGCSNSDSLVVHVWDVPTVNINPTSANLCVGETLDLTASAQFAQELLWWNGDSGTTNIFFAEEPGTFHLWVNATNGYGCTVADTAFVTVNPLPQFQLEIFEGSATICAGETVTLQVTILGQTVVDQIVWNVTDTISLNGQTTLYQDFLLTQTTSITATAITNQGCSDSKMLLFSVTPLPDITVTSDKEGCLGTVHTLEAVGGVQCAWYDAGGLIVNGYTITVEPQETKKYYAVVTGDSPTFCNATDSVLVTVYPLPIIDIVASSTTVCQGSPVTLVASGASTYEWSTNQIGSQITVNPQQDETYLVQGFTDFGCSADDSISISIYPVTPVSFSGLSPVYCENDPSVILTGNPLGGIFLGSGMVTNLFNPILAGPGIHEIIYKITNEFECYSADTVSTFVIAFNKTINLGPDTLFCPNQSILLDAGEGFADYLWSNGQTTQQIVVSGLDYPAGTSRNIAVAGIFNGCTATGNVHVTIRDDCFIGLEERADQPPIRIAPNPNTGSFDILWLLPTNQVSLNLYDSKGAVVLNKKIAEISISDFTNVTLPQNSKGVYLLSVMTNFWSYTTKVIVE